MPPAPNLRVSSQHPKATKRLAYRLSLASDQTPEARQQKNYFGGHPTPAQELKWLRLWPNSATRSRAGWFIPVVTVYGLPDDEIAGNALQNMGNSDVSPGAGAPAPYFFAAHIA